MMVEQLTGENRRKGAFGIITGVHGKLLSCEGPGPGDRWPHSRDSRGWGTRPICKQCCGVISARRQAIHGRGGRGAAPVWNGAFGDRTSRHRCEPCCHQVSLDDNQAPLGSHSSLTHTPGPPWSVLQVTPFIRALPPERFLQFQEAPWLRSVYPKSQNLRAWLYLEAGL